MPRLLLLTTLLLLLAACSREEGPLPPQGEPAALARVTVTGTGLFKVEPRTLSTLGWTVESPLTLTLNEEPLPYQTHEGALYFYLPDSTPARYSNQHALWLRHGSAPAAPALPDDATPLETLVAEQRLTGSEQYSAHYVGDPWFWRTLVAPTTEPHEIATPRRPAGSVTVLVRVGGVTQVAHQLIVRLNGEEAGKLEWQGVTRHEQSFTVELPAGEAIAVELEVPESTGAGVDMSMIDDIIVQHPAPPRATEGQFRGHAEQAGAVTVEGLGADAIAWQVEPEVLPLTIREGQIFLPAENAVVLSERRLAQPATAERVTQTTIETEGAEYVAIVAPELADAVEPLLAFHREAGLSVISLAPQQLYDAYTAGAVDPLAFRALLADAAEQWGTKPRFVLLVGDSTYDPGGNQNELPPSYLPSPFVQTVFGGETVSDNVIADVDEDGYPDIALGRLPARTPEQLQAIVTKILGYSQQPPEGAWRDRILFTADGREALFKETSERLRGALPEGVESRTFYPEEAAADPMAEIVPALSEGSYIVNYIGHGSVQQWGRDKLLTVEAVSDLSNQGRLPIFINMTCLTGLFSHPSQESLAETLLWAPNGGAIAALAPSSLTLPTTQSALNQALLAELFQAERPTLGEAVMRAKQAVPLTNSNEHDIVATFNLLGDPALQAVPMQ